MKMRSYLFAVAFLLTGAAALAQTNTGIGIHFGGYDFYGPQSDEYFRAERNRYEYNDAKGAYDTTTENRILWRPMVKLSYWREVTKNFTLSGSLSFASL